MCRKIFIAATGQNTGKNTIGLSLVHLARQKYQLVGFIKAVGPKCQEFKGLVVEKDAALMARVFGLEEDIWLMSPVVLGRGSTKRFLDGHLTTAELEERLINACREMERRNDFLVIEGAGHGGVGSLVGLSNGRVAALCDAPVAMVSGGGIGESTTAETYSAISGLTSKISPEDDEKIELICSLAEKVMDFEAIDRLL